MSVFASVNQCGSASLLLYLCLLGAQTDGVYWAPDAKFSHCRRAIYGDGHEPSSTSKTPHASSPSSKLHQATSLPIPVQNVYESLGERFASILMIPLDDITPNKPVVAYRLDSLVAIEIRNWLDRELEAKVPLMELLSASSLTALAESVVGRSGIVDSNVLVDDRPKSRENGHI